MAAKGEKPTEEKGSPEPKDRTRWLLIAVLVLSALAYLNSLSGDFLYDDRIQVVRNPTLPAPFSLAVILKQPFWHFAETTERDVIPPYYRPVTSAFFVLLYKILGLHPLGWHLVSLFLHLLATYLVYRLAKAWGFEPPQAVAAAALFGLHPVHCESVSWISAIPDPIAAVLLLTAFLMHERGQVLPASGLVFLAMLTKEPAMVAPAVLFFRDVYAGSEAPLRRIARAALRALPSGLAAAVMLGLRVHALGSLIGRRTISEGVTNLQALLTIPSVVLEYLRLLFLPIGLAFLYGLDFVASAADSRVVVSALLLATIATLTIWALRTSPAGQSALALMVLFLLPVLNLKAFNREESLFHDRYLYLSSIGFCMLLALLLARTLERFRHPEIFRHAVTVVCAAYFVLTVRQNTFFHDDVALFERANRATGPTPRANVSLGAYYLMERGDKEAAARAFEEALRLNPKGLDAVQNLAEIRRQQGRLTEAEELYLRAIALGSRSPDIYANLGVVRLLQGRFADALPELRRALAMNPENVGTRYNLAWAYQKDGRMTDAEGEYREVVRREPAYREAWINLGGILSDTRRFEEAIGALLKARGLDPGNLSVLFRLAEAYQKAGKCSEAMPLLSTLTTQAPREGAVHALLGLCYESMGLTEKARSAYAAATRLSPDSPQLSIARERRESLGR